MAAWGQIRAHWLHWMQFSDVQTGTSRRDAPLLETGGGRGNPAVNRHLGHRKRVALEAHDGLDDASG